MCKTRKVIATLISTVLAGSLTGCGSEPVAYQDIPPRPQIEGYVDEYWEWDEEEGEWEYEEPGGARWYYYGGKLYKNSIKTTPGYKPYSSVKSSSSSGSSSSFASKSTGFGSGSKGGFFGG